MPILQLLMYMEQVRMCNGGFVEKIEGPLHYEEKGPAGVCCGSHEKIKKQP